MREALLGKSRDELRATAEALGASRWRGDQLFDWLYRNPVQSVEEMTNVPEAVRHALDERYDIGARPPTHVTESSDGTKKYLFPTRAGGFVEAALIPEGDRLTLCLSTQVGCRRGCTFCQTARQGFQGNLEPAEILGQYHALPERDRVTNIVYMGMGEPLDNLPAVITSLERFTDPEGYGLGVRKVTLSTVGIQPHLEAFLDQSPVNLAISVHSPFPAERRRIMPVENANPIEETFALIRRRREDRARRISVEYTLFAGVNDTRAHVDGLAKLTNGLRIRVNLIPYHTIDGAPWRPTEAQQIEQFAAWLRAKEIRTSVRRSRGQDIAAACGMLWTRSVAQ